MLMNIFRMLKYFFPFIKEVFYQSSEDKRVWLSRMIILVFLIAVVFISGVSYLFNDYTALKRTIYLKETTVERLREESALLKLQLSNSKQEVVKLERNLASSIEARDGCNTARNKLETKIKALTESQRDVEHNLDDGAKSEAVGPKKNRLEGLK